MRHLTAPLAAVAAALAIAAPACAADVVYDQGALSGMLGAQIFSNYFGAPLYVADSFTLSAPVTVGAIQFGVWDDRAQPLSFDWSFATGPASSHPTVIASGQATDLTFVDTPFFGTGLGNLRYRVRIASFAVDPVALGAQTYWLRLNTPTVGLVGWDFAAYDGVYEQGFVGGQDFGTFPGRHSFQLFGVAAPPPAVVPEPAAWTLMIGGFGLAGTTLRRRREVRV